MVPAFQVLPHASPSVCLESFLSRGLTCFFHQKRGSWADFALPARGRREMHTQPMTAALGSCHGADRPKFAFSKAFPISLAICSQAEQGLFYGKGK